MTAAEAAAWVEIIKAIGSALGVVIGAIGLVYGRAGFKQAKQAVAQTATAQLIGGQIKKKSSAVTAEEALDEARQVRAQLDALLLREQQRGTGARRVDTAPQPEFGPLVAVQPPQAPVTPITPDTRAFQRLPMPPPPTDPPNGAA